MKEVPEVGSYTVEIIADDSETYDHTVEFYNCLKESWLQEGLVHRRGGPAIVRRDQSSGKIISQEWLEEGKRHRIDSPAFIYERNERKIEAWYEKGKRHRLDGPSLVDIYNHRGMVWREEWQVNGKYHRVEGPAIIRRDPETGIALFESWYREGEYHRENNKPAIICRSEEDGLAYSEGWYQHGKLHRTGGPAKVDREGEFGEIIKFEYYELGEKINSSKPASINLSF